MLKSLVPTKTRSHFRKVRDWFRIHLISDERYLKYLYKKKLGKTLDLKNPKTLNEKIQWLKLHYRPKKLTKISDKCLAREYIKEKVGEKYLVPLIFCTDNVYDIREEALPDYPVIIKTNHDSGGGIFVFDQRKVDYKAIRKELVKRLKKNYYYAKREWQYKNIKPRIIVEKLLVNREGELPPNTSVICLNGKAVILSVYTDPDKNHYQDDFNENFILPSGERIGPISDKIDIEKYRKQKLIKFPENSHEIIDISESLSVGFPLMRVDLYDVDDRIYVGEMTLTPVAGFSKYKEKWNNKLGEQLKLPISHII